jgi:hypothetical protein
LNSQRYFCFDVVGCVWISVALFDVEICLTGYFTFVPIRRRVVEVDRAWKFFGGKKKTINKKSCGDWLLTWTWLIKNQGESTLYPHDVSTYWQFDAQCLKIGRWPPWRLPLVSIWTFCPLSLAKVTESGSRALHMTT